MSTISADEYFGRMHQVVSLLDSENIKIIRTMKLTGPRNLQNVARASKIPYTTVYSRVTRLENTGLLKTRIHPNYSKIGLSLAVVLVTPLPGKEFLTREALKIPNYWTKIARCIGDCNGYFSLVTVPTEHSKNFEEYLDQLVVRGLVRNWRAYWLGENYSPIPNFDYYDISKKTWTFEWKKWLSLFKKKGARSSRISKHEEPAFDERDLIILKELVKNARTTLARLAKMLLITLPAAKYRFDAIIEKGLVEDYIINMLPFAPEISDLSEVRLDFRDETLSKNAGNILRELPFVLTYSQIRGMNSLSVRVYIPRVELANLLTFLSHLVKENILSSYSYSQLDRMTLQVQTFSYEEYTEEKGWKYDNRKYLETLDNLISNWPRLEQDLVDFRIQPTIPL